MARVRFEDVDLLGALSRIVDLHTQHYKEDFDLDKELISKLAVSDRSEDKQLLSSSCSCVIFRFILASAIRFPIVFFFIGKKFLSLSEFNRLEERCIRT